MIFDEDKNRGKCKHCGKEIQLTKIGYVHTWKGFGSIYNKDRIVCRNSYTVATPITKNDIVIQILKDL